jgi:putative hydrolase of HD superfamily
MEQLLNFIRLTHKFRSVKRKVVFSDREEPENDAEHSYQLALTAWYIISSKKLDLDLELVFKYAIAHDLVEAYAGDTPAAVHKAFAEEQKTKIAREKEAAKRISNEFPEFGDLHEFIHRYEERSDAESRFVYALDKIMPVMNIYLDQGHAWKVNNIDIEDVVRYKEEQIAEVPEIKNYFDLLVPLIRGLRM